MSAPDFHRVVVAQGSLQLLTALSVVDARLAEGKSPGDAVDHLVVFDVSEPFRRFITDLAMGLRNFRSVHFLTPAEISVFSRNPAQLRSKLDLPKVDEIYLCRNWQDGNLLLMNCYETANFIAYGDGVGFYFGPHRFDPGAKGIRNRLRSWLNSMKKPGSAGLDRLAKKAFSAGYYLYPTLYEEVPPEPVFIPDRSFLDGVFQRAAQLLQNQLRLELSDSIPTLLFLPGNFAPLWTTAESEIAAYLEVLDAAPSRDAAQIVIKPHPRNSAEMIDSLRAGLAMRFKNVLVISEPQSFVPIEIMVQFGQLNRERTVVYGFTSACLSLKSQFGLRCETGFGDLLLRRYFPENAHRMGENEALLKRMMAKLGKMDESVST